MKKDTEIIDDIEINNYYFDHEGNKEADCKIKLNI